MNKQLENKIKKLPTQPGIYLFYNAQKELLYVGKATTLKNRVQSYFSGTQKSIRPIEDMISEVKDIKWIAVDSVLEAIILEANYIKKYQPRYNVEGKDDKSWNYLAVTRDKFPKLVAIRQHGYNNSKFKIKNSKFLFGPYPGIKTNEMLKILQRLFSISYCQPNQDKPCFYRQLGQCLGVCAGEITAEEYQEKVIRPLIKFLRGNKKGLIQDLMKQMLLASERENFEEAGRLRDQINNLKKIQDVALLNKDFFNKKIENSKLKIENFRLEAYDISNLGESGKVGSMAVLNMTGPVKSDYRKFKIRTVAGQSDVDCLKEVINRRLRHSEWPRPDIILVDGGKPQVNAVRAVFIKNFPFTQWSSPLQKMDKKKFLPDRGEAVHPKIGGRDETLIPIIGIAKGQKRKKNEFIYNKKNRILSSFIQHNEQLLIQARDEAHRFAIEYQKKLRTIHF